MRWKRRRLAVRAWRKGRELIRLGPAPRLPRGAIPCFAVMRDEAVRLPHWLAHHRALGVDRFLIVDNGSTDGTLDMLRAEPDVTVWRTSRSTVVRELLDYSTAVFDRDGYNVAQAARSQPPPQPKKNEGASTTESGHRTTEGRVREAASDLEASSPADDWDPRNVATPEDKGYPRTSPPRR